jgi:hypothetical protein
MFLGNIGEILLRYAVLNPKRLYHFQSLLCQPHWQEYHFYSLAFPPS